MVEINPRSGSIKPESQPKSRNLNIPGTGGKKKRKKGAHERDKREKQKQKGRTIREESGK